MKLMLLTVLYQGTVSNRLSLSIFISAQLTSENKDMDEVSKGWRVGGAVEKSREGTKLMETRHQPSHLL